MVREQLRKCFSRAAVRTAASLVLGVTLVLSSASPAGETTHIQNEIPVDPPAIVEVAPASVQGPGTPAPQATPAPAKKSAKPAVRKDFIKVTLKEAKDVKGLLKSYPFLNEALDAVLTASEDPEMPRTKVYIADLQKKNTPRLFFITMKGDLECGTEGCSLMVYRQDKKDFTLALYTSMDVNAFSLYLSKDRLTMLTCSPHGRTMWRLQDGTYAPTGADYHGPQKLKSCPTP